VIILAKGLTDKQQFRVFVMLNAVLEVDAPLTEDARVDFLAEAYHEHDRAEPAYSALCANIVWTLWLCRKNRSSLWERECVEHIAGAYMDGQVSDDDLKMANIGSILSSLLNFYIENPDKTAEEIDALFSYTKGLVGEGLFTEREWRELQAVAAEASGNFKEAELHIKVFLSSQRTDESDCEGCEQDRLIKGFLKMGNMENAAHYANEVFRRKLKCESDIPEKTRIQYALIAQFVGGDRESPKALAKLLAKASKDIYASKTLIFEAAVFICAALNLGDMKSAAETVGIFSSVVNDFPYEVGSFQFYLAAYFASLASGDSVGMEHWLARAKGYAAAFDTRNGNEYYASCIDAALEVGGLWRVRSHKIRTTNS
jgi:hypothetical protein